MNGDGVKNLSQPVHSFDIPLSLIFKISVLKNVEKYGTCSSVWSVRLKSEALIGDNTSLTLTFILVSKFGNGICN